MTAQTAQTLKTQTPAANTVPAEALAAMSGLDLLLAMGAGKLPMPPMNDVIPMVPVAAERGAVTFEAEPEARFYNPLGTVHGGYAATLLDTAMGCAVHSTLKAGQGYSTLEFKVNFVRAMSESTGRVRIEGKIINRGRQVATAEGRLLDARDRLLAHATTTCLLFSLPTPA